MKEPLLISACLLGVPCRYDGRGKKYDGIEALRKRFDLIPVCPEMLGGLTVPRAPCEIKNGKAVTADGCDRTAFFEKGANAVLSMAKERGCSKALLKEKSPSCGIHRRYDGTFSGKLVEKMGVTAKLLAENGFCLYSEETLELLL